MSTCLGRSRIHCDVVGAVFLLAAVMEKMSNPQTQGICKSHESYLQMVVYMLTDALLDCLDSMEFAKLSTEFT